jgi:hypothetical protein
MVQRLTDIAGSEFDGGATNAKIDLVPSGIGESLLEHDVHASICHVDSAKRAMRNALNSADPVASVRTTCGMSGSAAARHDRALVAVGMSW